MPSRDGYLWIARKKPPGQLIPVTGKPLILPGVTDSLETRDLLQAVLEKRGIPWETWMKYVEQAEINREYRAKLEAARLELRRRIEGQVRKPVDKFIPRKVI